MYTYKLYYYVCIQAWEGGTQTQAGQGEKEASSWRAYVGSEFVEGVQTQAGQGEKEAPPEIDSAEGGGGKGGVGAASSWRAYVAPSGHEYYHNETSGETTWTKPHG